MNIKSLADNVADFFARIQTGHRVLENHLHILAKSAPSLTVKCARNFVAIEDNFAVGGVVESNDTAPDSRLAGAAFADKSVSFAGKNFKGDTVDSFDCEVARNLEMLTEILDLQERFTHKQPSSNESIALLIRAVNRFRVHRGGGAKLQQNVFPKF